MTAGREVPHVHLHVSPINRVTDLGFVNTDPNASDGSIDDAADRIRAAFADSGTNRRADGHG